VRAVPDRDTFGAMPRRGPVHLVAPLAALISLAVAVGCEALLTPRDRLVSQEPANGTDGTDGTDGAPLGDGGALADAFTDASCDADLANDPHNCGACGHDCCEGLCQASACLPVQLASGGEPRGLVLDATHIYWTDRADGTVRSRPKSRVGQETILATGAPSVDVGQIGVDDANVYYTSSGALLAVPKGGGAQARTVLGGLSAPHGATAYGGGVYYVNDKDVLRVATDGSGDGPITSLPYAGAWMIPSPEFLYLTAKLVRVPLVGGAQEGPNFDCAAAALGATDVFAGHDYGSEIALVRLDAARFDAETELFRVPRLDGLATTDDGRLIYPDSVAGAIVRVDRDGMNREVLADHMKQPAFVVLDDRCVYWSNPYGDGRIFKVAQ